MKILVLAGGYDQKDLIIALKARQHRVLLADYLEHPPAREAADAFFRISTLDVEAVTKLARAEQVDRVITACTDQALLTAAQVSEDLGLPFYLTYEKACQVTNKVEMKATLVRTGIPTAPYKILSGPQDMALELAFPRVVKPVDSNSSKGVCKVTRMEDMEAAATAALKESRSGTALVESFLPGDEVSVDAYIQGGQAVVLMLSETVKVPHTDGFTIVQSRVPAQATREAEAAIADICQQIADSFGLNETPLLVQCVVRGGQAWVLEFSARMGGGTKHRLVQACTGVDMIQVFTDRVLGGLPRIQPAPGPLRASLTYCYGQSGEFSHLEQVETLRKAGIITGCFQYKTAGMILTKAQTSGDRVCGFLIIGSDPEEIRHKEEQAGRLLRIMSMDGRDLFRRDMLPGYPADAE